MLIATNQRLKCMLADIQIDLDDALTQALSEDPLNFIHVDGCTLRETFPPHLIKDNFPDKTGLECFINHIHFSVNTKLEMLAVFANVSTVSSALKQETIYKNYKIIASFNNGKATVRFHAVRPNEEWLNYSNLESFQDEGILVITVGEKG